MTADRNDPLMASVILIDQLRYRREIAALKRDLPECRDQRVRQLGHQVLDLAEKQLRPEK